MNFDLLLEYDQALFLFLNRQHAFWLDELMWLLSNKWFFLPLYFYVAYLFIQKYTWKKGIGLLLFLAVAIAFTDQSCTLIKKKLQRPRPSHQMEQVYILHEYRGGLYGFPSSHAGNSFAFWVFIVGLHFSKRWKIGLFCWAILVSYSRIYLGVHFPLDLCVGAMIGVSFGFLFVSLARKFLNISFYE